MGHPFLWPSRDCRGDTQPARGSKLTLLSKREKRFVRTVDGYHPSIQGLKFSSFYQDFFNFFLKIDIGIDRSENLLEPGIIILFSLGVHLSNSFLIMPFQKWEPLYTKLCLNSSRLCFGILIARLELL